MHTRGIAAPTAAHAVVNLWSSGVAAFATPVGAPILGGSVGVIAAIPFLILAVYLVLSGALSRSEQHVASRWGTPRKHRASGRPTATPSSRQR